MSITNLLFLSNMLLLEIYIYMHLDSVRFSMSATPYSLNKDEEFHILSMVSVYEQILRIYH